MRAAIRSRYGPPHLVRIEEVNEPIVADDQVLVQLRAASINRADWYSVTGRPFVARLGTGLRIPKDPRIGGDFAGTVEEVGASVTDFRPGDDVFGGRSGAFAERLVVRNAVVTKPPGISFEQAAAIPTAGVTALQALRDHGGLQAGQQVLVNGASGGVGVFAVQIAKVLGGVVTAVCSTANVEQASRLGADEVVDYTREDFTARDARFDVVIDIAGSRKWREFKKVLAPTARVVVVGGPKDNAVLGPLLHIAGIRVASMLGSQASTFFIAGFNRADLTFLGKLAESGELQVPIEATYPFERVADALRHMEGHVRSKVVLTF
ncbi:MAG: NAD(P)-dependent alcohol dehydrogenase [Acidimicrobiia bacterium]